MKEFRCISDFIFLAENIDDAFLKLSEHFKKCVDLGSDDYEDDQLIKRGHIKIGPNSSNGQRQIPT